MQIPVDGTAIRLRRDCPAGPPGPAGRRRRHGGTLPRGHGDSWPLSREGSVTVHAWPRADGMLSDPLEQLKERYARPPGIDSD